MRQLIAVNPRLVVRSLRTLESRKCARFFKTQTQLTSTSSRPNIPFLVAPTAQTQRRHSSQQSKWIRHEVKFAVRWTLGAWAALGCLLIIYAAVGEELLEHDYPTPHEWNFRLRKTMRSAKHDANPRDGRIKWPAALLLFRSVLVELDTDPAVIELSGKEDPTLDISPREFLVFDISAKSEEWRRGYFEAIMQAAKAAEHSDGWVKDTKLNLISPPEHVVGPSNPHPTPIPVSWSHAPREEDCVPLFPATENWYMKAMATRGFTPRQRMQIILEYAAYEEYKNRAEGAEALLALALAEATSGLDPASIPYNPKTFVLKDTAGSPSLNMLDALTAVAHHRARTGRVSEALPIYLSLLKSRRTLSNEEPRVRKTKPMPQHLHTRIINWFAPPAYPPPPPDGLRSPWRSPQELCQEASLNVYIGEILYATSSKEDGLAWTRDGVDAAEEKLHSLGPLSKDNEAKTTCRECLNTGLGNWAAMVGTLAMEEKAREEAGKSVSSMFSFWGSSNDADGRWEAERAVVQDRIRRTRGLMMDDVKAPAPSMLNYLKA